MVTTVIGSECLERTKAPLLSKVDMATYYGMHLCHCSEQNQNEENAHYYFHLMNSCMLIIMHNTSLNVVVQGPV
jgi:hypothetical protein